MCGIAGYLNKGSAIYDFGFQPLQREMRTGIEYRGLDGQGSFVERNEFGELFLAHSRLSIIDLDAGAQPMTKNGITIVFNGEIYNYKDLKRELEQLGVIFQTSSDTEVVIEVFRLFGINGFARFDGMYAFALFDAHANKLYIHRDSFGEKPLYYAQTEECFFFASDLKAFPDYLKKSLSQEAMELFFSLTYIPAPHSIYRDIKKCLPSELLVVDCLNLGFEKTKIAKLEKRQGRLYDLMQYSVDLCLTADVEVACLLSGGIDSAIIAHHASKDKKNLKAFTLAFDNKNFDELQNARSIAQRLKMEHHVLTVGLDEMDSVIDEAISTFSEPFADPSLVPSFLVTRFAGNRVKVVLTGDGGDEIFAGYRKYQMIALNRLYTRFIPKVLHDYLEKLALNGFRVTEDKRGIRFRVRRFFSNVSYEGDEYLQTLCMAFNPIEFDKLFVSSQCSNARSLLGSYTEDGNKLNDISDCRKLDRKLSLEGDMLVKMDRLGMKHQLESRSPFLREFLWNYSLINAHKLMFLNVKKLHLKLKYIKVLGLGYITKKKRGFGAPVGDLLRVNRYKEMLKFTNEEFIKRQGIFKSSYIQEIWSNHVSRKEDNTYKLWTYYCFQKWLASK